MRILSKVKDGGPDSNVDAYVLIEIKSLFSIMLLKFNKGSRENYHSHAFNALSIYLTGCTDEMFINRPTIRRKGFNIKYTPRNMFHKIFAYTNAWCLTFRGPWCDTWQEYNKESDKYTTLTHGRKEI